MIRVGGQSGTAILIVMSLLHAALPAPSRAAALAAATVKPLIPDVRIVFLPSSRLTVSEPRPRGVWSYGKALPVSRLNRWASASDSSIASSWPGG